MQADVVIIGGGPAGIITALTARMVYPDRSVCLVKQIGDGVIPCAIPYMINTLESPQQNAMGNTPLERAKVQIVVDEATAIDLERRSVALAGGDQLSYERLVLATGTTPVVPPIPGAELDGVHAVTKSMSAMTRLRDDARAARNIVIIGGGFIGAEFADEIAAAEDVTVHLVEMLPGLVQGAFDDDLCQEIRQLLEQRGVVVHTGRKVSRIEGEGRVRSVTLDSGEQLPAELVLLGAGARPATELARTAGLRLVDDGAVWVDDYMRTVAEDVFAVGDCALKRDFFTRRAVPIWLASTATAEARIAGTNLFGIRVLRQIQGTIAAFSTKVGGRAFASAGMTRRVCEREGFRAVSATASAPDRHPGTLPGASTMKVTLVFSDRSGIILGGQISGGPSVGELINMVALAIQKRTTVRELEMMQLATHPLLTAAPTVHPVVVASQQALNTMRRWQPEPARP
jgi:NADPH-dependent 2,4-dienoyl-CoA reductase/sulfur reductase-like enzyme